MTKGIDNFIIATDKGVSMNDQNELGSRHRHHWSGRDRAKDVEALADKVAAVVELYNDDGRLVQLGPAGELVPVNFAAFRDLIANSIAGVRVVNRGGGGVWRCEFYGYAFAPKPRFNPTAQTPQPPADSDYEPDATVLDELFRELPSRLPRVERKG
jgi:hypothetical protein